MKGKLIKTGKLYALAVDDIIATTDDYLNTKLGYLYRLSLKNCQAIENGYDLDELADEYAKYMNDDDETSDIDFKVGFQKALEILGDKKFSEEDILDVWEDGATKQHPLTREKKEKLFKALQQKEWKVEVIMDRIPADLAPGGWDVFPKLDAEGCIILKRVE